MRKKVVLCKGKRLVMLEPMLQLLPELGNCDYPVASNSIHFYSFPGLN